MMMSSLGVEWVWVDEGKHDNEEIKGHCLMFFDFFSCLVQIRLTHTPRKTSGRGWTLVNVGL